MEAKRPPIGLFRDIDCIGMWWKFRFCHHNMKNILHNGKCKLQGQLPAIGFISKAVGGDIDATGIAVKGIVDIPAPCRGKIRNDT